MFLADRKSHYGEILMELVNATIIKLNIAIENETSGQISIHICLRNLRK